MRKMANDHLMDLFVQLKLTSDNSKLLVELLTQFDGSCTQYTSTAIFIIKRFTEVLLL